MDSVPDARPTPAHSLCSLSGEHCWPKGLQSSCEALRIRSRPAQVCQLFPMNQEFKINLKTPVKKKKKCRVEVFKWSVFLCSGDLSLQCPCLRKLQPKKLTLYYFQALCSKLWRILDVTTPSARWLKLGKFCLPDNPSLYFASQLQVTQKGLGQTVRTKIFNLQKTIRSKLYKVWGFLDNTHLHVGLLKSIHFIANGSKTFRVTFSP